MFPRPVTVNDALVKILKLLRKLNEVLEEILTTENDAHIISVTTLTQPLFFDFSANLTEKGKRAFWGEVNTILKKFDADDSP